MAGSNDLNARQRGILLTDLDTALTFMEVAEATDETVQRNHANARHAYDTIVRLLRDLDPTPAQRQMLDENLSALKARLQAAGQQF